MYCLVLGGAGFIVEETTGGCPDVKFDHARRFEVPGNSLDAARVREGLGWSDRIAWRKLIFYLT